jgi:hypothetical protein
MTSALIGIDSCNLSELELKFFSIENINTINNLLILEVFNRTNKEYKIVKQSERSLLIVMRYVYIEYSNNLPYCIDMQINILNRQVVNEVTPDIITAITQHTGYIKDINRPLEPPPLPINSSVSKTLKPMLTFRKN